MLRPLLLSALLAATGLAHGGTITTLGHTLSYQGILKNAGATVNGTFIVDICLYDNMLAGNLVGCQEATNVVVADGLMNLVVNFPDGTFDGTPFFAEISIAPSTGGPFTTLAPRQAITAVPEAAHAQFADFSGTTGSVRWTDITNMPAGFSDGVDDIGTGGGGSGTVTSIIAGAGLSGGTITTSGTLSVDFAQVQPRIAGTCNVGFYFRGTDTSGTALCEPLPTTTSTVTLGNFGSRFEVAMALPSDGRPVIGIQALAAGQTETRLLRCADSRCSSVGSNVLLHSVTPFVPTSVYSDVGIAIGSDGFPLVAYQDTSTYQIKLTRCTNASCSTSNTVTIDSPTGSNVLGDKLSLHVPASGRPLIAYSSTGGSGQVRLARCGNVACTGVTPNVVIQSNIGTTNFSAINLGSDSSGNPQLAYQDSTAQELRLSLCTDAACSTVPSPITVESLGSSSATYASLAFRNPGLTYVRNILSPGFGTGHCNLTCAGGGASLGSFSAPATTTADWITPEIRIPADQIPVIVTNETSDSGIWLARCYDRDCLDGAEVHLVAGDSATIGRFAFILGSDQLPLIAYQDATSNLRFLRCATRTCR